MTDTIHKMLELSTAHLQPHTLGAWLDTHAEIHPSGIIDTTYGWIISTRLLRSKVGPLPADLAECLHYADNEDCEYVMFDCDAEVCDDLTVYEHC